MKFLLLFFLTFSHIFLFSQNFQERFTNNYYVVKCLSISKFITNSDVENAQKYIDSCIIRAKKIQNKYLLAKLYFQKSKILDNQYLYDSSFLYYKLALPYFIEFGDSVCAAKCCINIGASHYYYGNYDSAFIHYNLASEFLKNSDDTLLKSKVFNNLGLIYKSQGNYKKAIESFEQVINLLNPEKYTKNVANTTNNIGIVYWEQKNYQEALNKFFEALKLYEQTDNFDDIASVYANIGLIYSDLYDTSNAVFYFDKAIYIYDSINNNEELVSVLQNKALMYLYFNRMPQAEKLFFESLKISENINYKLGIFTVKTNLAGFYSKNNQAQKAVKYALESLKIKDLDYPLVNLSQSYFVLANAYFDANHFKEAALYFKKYVQTKDTLFNLDVHKQIVEIQTKYETERTEAELEIYRQKVLIQDLEIQNKKKKFLTAVTISFLTLIFAVIFIILYIQKQKSYLALVEQNIKLAKSDIEKEKLILKTTENKEKDIPKYSDTNLNETQKKKLIDNIITLMEEKKYFLNEQFTINDFAKELNSNRNYLSQIINDHFKTNFNNFINEFRVKEARKMLINPDFDNYTIEGIAKSVGFHSKATFNTAFKKFTGVTPSFFKNNSKIL